MRIGEKRRDCGSEGVFSDSDRAVRLRTPGDVLSPGFTSAPGMAYQLIFWTESGSKTPAVTGRKGNTNKTRASSEMAGLEEV